SESRAPDRSPIAIIFVTIDGKIVERANGSERLSPSFTRSRASSTIAEITRLPAVSETISIAPRIGTPLLTSVEKVRAKRDSATFLKSGPKTGARSLTRSQIRAPDLVFFQRAKRIVAPTTPPNSAYQ